MISTLHVLSIGSQDAGAIVRDVLVLRTRCRFYLAPSIWELCVVLESEEIDVAILHNTFSPQQVRVFAAYTRRRWPSATILLMNPKEENADYSIYDERTAPGVSSKTLLAEIEWLSACAGRARLPIASTPHSQVSKQNGRSRPKLTRAVQRS
jgi:hypothetical protein